VVFAPGIISTGGHELSITFSPDGEELFFCATGPTYRPRFIFHSRLEGGVWTAPREAPFSDPGRTDSYPFVTPDGNRVFFCSSRSSGESGARGRHHEIWFVDRNELQWAEPQKIDFGGDLGGFGTCPSVAANGNLYFNGGRGATGSDIFVSRYVDGRYTTPENLGSAVNSGAGDFHPFIAPDESFLLFDSQREGDSFGGNDLFISVRRADGSWSVAENLGPVVNTPSNDLRPCLTGDGKYLFFASSRIREDLVPDQRLDFESISRALHQPGNGLQDIYWVSSEFLQESSKG
jgi:Tol biopolymer transport system component